MKEARRARLPQTFNQARIPRVFHILGMICGGFDEFQHPSGAGFSPVSLAGAQGMPAAKNESADVEVGGTPTSADF
jgi:hypothetical protein